MTGTASPTILLISQMNMIVPIVLINELPDCNDGMKWL